MKTPIFTFGIEFELKDTFRLAEELMHRSITNMVSVLMMGFCGRDSTLVSQNPAVRRLEQLTASKDVAIATHGADKT